MIHNQLRRRRRNLKRSAPATRERASNESIANEVESFLERVKNAQTHYDVLGVNWDESAQDLKTVYYQLARRYHPDRFRKTQPALVSRLESAFARITQAYDTLRDDTLRASLQLKARGQKKSRTDWPIRAKSQRHPRRRNQAAEGVAEPAVSEAERAEANLKKDLQRLNWVNEKWPSDSSRRRRVQFRKNRVTGRFMVSCWPATNVRGALRKQSCSAAIKLDPGNAEYRVMLAELYRDLGLKLRAKGEAERAVAADPNNRKARDLLRALK